MDRGIERDWGIFGDPRVGFSPSLRARNIEKERLDDERRRAASLLVCADISRSERDFGGVSLLISLAVACSGSESDPVGAAALRRLRGNVTGGGRRRIGKPRERAERAGTGGSGPRWQRRHGAGGARRAVPAEPVAGGSGVGGSGGEPPLGTSVTVHLVPAQGVSGTQRVNLGLPLQPGQLSDAEQVRVLAGSQELRAARRALAKYPDGSLRSVQIQFDTTIAGEADIELHVGEAPTSKALTLASVDTTLVNPNGEQGPRVWPVLPAAWLSGSGFAGPLAPGVRRAEQRRRRRGPRSATTSAGAPRLSSPPATRPTARFGCSTAGPRCIAATRGAAISLPCARRTSRPRCIAIESPAPAPPRATAFRRAARTT